MSIDVGIIDQQNNRVGVISRHNLKTFNPPEESDTLGRGATRPWVDAGVIDQQNNRVGVISDYNLKTFNPPQITEHKKIMMRPQFVEVSYGPSTRGLFYQNQKLAGT